jgi:hypothetical protein
MNTLKNLVVLINIESERLCYLYKASWLLNQARANKACTRRWGVWRDSKHFSTPYHFSSWTASPSPAPARVTQTVGLPSAKGILSMNKINGLAGIDIQRAKTNKKPWLWGCAGAMTFLLIISCLVASLHPMVSPPSLKGDISFPSKVKQDDEFDITITLTNPTAKSVFIKDIAFKYFRFDTPILLDGVSVIGTSPEMKSESLNETVELFHYFRDLRSRESQTFTFHMKVNSNSSGGYAGDIVFYAKHPFLGTPFFQNAQFFSGVQIEITK